MLAHCEKCLTPCRDCLRISGRARIAPTPCHAVRALSCRRMHRRGCVSLARRPVERCTKPAFPGTIASGDRLREWLGLTREQFYDPRKTAIIPMGFCYPGKAASGDNPPRPECAPRWHEMLNAHLPDITLTLLVGQHAQAYYLGDRRKATLRETIKAWKEFLPRGYLPLPHPSPRNQPWLVRNPWFEERVRARGAKYNSNHESYNGYFAPSFPSHYPTRWRDPAPRAAIMHTAAQTLAGPTRGSTRQTLPRAIAAPNANRVDSERRSRGAKLVVSRRGSAGASDGRL